MTRILSQEELDALLSASADSAGPRAAKAPSPAVAYNFRRQDRLSKDHLRSLQVLHDRLVKRLSTQLSAYLRAQTDLTIVSIDQVSYGEYLTNVADPTAFYAVSLGSIESSAALDIAPVVAFAIVDRMMGGGGKGVAPNRALTDIELNVVDSIVRQLLDGLTETWRPMVGASFGIRARETRPQMLPVTSADDAMVVLTVDAHIGEVQGRMSLCLPAAMVESSHKDSASSRKRLPPSVTPTEREWMLEHLGRVPVPVSPLIETSASGRDVLGLEVGDVLSLGLPIDAPIAVKVGGLPKLQGRLVARDRQTMLQVVGAPGAGASMTGDR